MKSTLNLENNGNMKLENDSGMNGSIPDSKVISSLLQNANSNSGVHFAFKV